MIPTWNEVENITYLIKDIKKVLEGVKYEIIIVDRHSQDGTAKLARDLGAKVIYDDKGKGSALIKGFKEAKGDIIVSMDADLSNRASELKMLIAAIESGYDVCMGSRYLLGGGSNDMPLYRRIANKILVDIVNILYRSHYSDLCYGFRSFSKEALKKLDLKEEGFGIETEINIKAQKAHLKIIEIPSLEKKRENGEAKLHAFRDGYIIIKTIFKNYFAPEQKGSKKLSN
ncbi:MAG: glycosyltransferase family 2 protein [Candidatus Micrarchaeia archaeon]